MVTAPPMYIHDIHHYNDIFNINISSQCHSQHQHHLISMTLSITTSSHINIIINNNIILYQRYHKHQCHLISINIINNIISKSHFAHTYIYSSCLRFTLPRFSNNTSLIKTIMSFINNRCIASH